MRWRSRSSPPSAPLPARRRHSLHPLARRLRDGLGLPLRAGRPRAQPVHRVVLGGLCCKQVVLSDRAGAADSADLLRRLEACDGVPRLLFAEERTLWVEYVEGRTLRSGVPLEAAAAGVADVLAALHAARPRRVPSGQTPFFDRLERDLQLLAQAGVLSQADARALLARGRALLPAALWIGDDCTDAILKNFVRTPAGRVCAVDVESLAPDQLLGIGAAKAALRWLGPARAAFLARLRERGAEHVLPQLPFAELCFRAFWTRSSLLEGKIRFAVRENLVPFLATAGNRP